MLAVWPEGEKFLKSEDVWDEVDTLIDGLVLNHYPTLKDANIGILFQRVVRLRGYETHGIVSRGSEQYNVLTDQACDFVLVLNWEYFAYAKSKAEWMDASMPKEFSKLTAYELRVAWIDDLLCCCGGDRVDGYTKENHPVWFWPEVASRHRVFYCEIIGRLANARHPDRQDSLDLGGSVLKKFEEQAKAFVAGELDGDEASAFENLRDSVSGEGATLTLKVDEKEVIHFENKEEPDGEGEPS
jgi:hypothetical protein